MIDVLLQIGIAKLLVSCVLACLVLIVQRSVGHPTFIHRFWLLVLVALLLPAVVAIPVLPGDAGAAAVGVSWQEWQTRLKEARAKPGGTRVIHVSPQAPTGQVWQLQGRIR